ncbi:hypothetical protein D915_010867 [Fasciola hepatica]|uniref:HSA domain-containing protein n=1 Tax=Fasciola hepatica TaxID=6192 RepID=A0A4E0R728_FASHE|nr:hypothetical protein D915_010867 [Fasciola hepatica]
MTMPCSSDEVPPATKRLRLTSPSSQCGLSVDEVGRICSASKEKCELEVLTQELDSLDEDAVFAQMRRCLTAGVVQPLVSTLPPLSGLYPFIMRNNVIENCVYLPPQKVAHNGFPELTENTTTDPHPAVDTARPEIALGARLEATVLQRVAHQKHQGLWSATRLPKVMEPRQGRSHHEYLIGEILWLSTDFAEERKWKKEVACHVSAHRPPALNEYFKTGLFWLTIRLSHTTT